MDLGNPFKAVVHYLLIRWMIGLDNRDRVSMVSALVCMVTHWIGLMVCHYVYLSSSYDLTKLQYYMVSSPWGNIELVLKFAMVLTYGWDPEMGIYSLWIGSLLWNQGLVNIDFDDNKTRFGTNDYISSVMQEDLQSDNHKDKIKPKINQ